MTKINNFVADAIKPVLLVLVIILLTYFALGESLYFALNGDDWLSLWRYLKDFTSFQSHFDLKNYSTDYRNYVFANIIMGIIYKFFQFEPLPYYLISMILRIIAALSFYPAVFAATKSKPAAFLASIFFTSMFAGIETTNWVFNMNTYLALAVFNFFIFFYFSENFRWKILRMILLAILPPIALFVAPTRMHGLLFFIPALIIITQDKKRFLKNSLFKFSLLFIPLFLAQNLISARDTKSYLNIFLPAIKNLFFTAGLLLANLGHILLPNKIIVFNHISPTPGYILLGLFYILLTLIIIFHFRKILPQLTKISLLFLSLPILFLIIPVMINYPTSFSSEHRYLLIPGAYLLSSVAINLALIWHIGWLRGIVILAVTAIIFINLSTLGWYLDLMSKEGRLQTDRQKQFKTIKSSLQDIPKKTPLVFLILPDDPFYAYNTIQFGFSYQMILTDNRFSWDENKEPLIVDNFESLIGVLNNPSSQELKRYGYQPVDVPIENAYILTLQNKTLLDTTSSYKPYILEKLSAKRSQKKKN